MELNVTTILVGVTCLVSYLCFQDRSLFERLKHHPYSEEHKGEYYRMLSSGFVHASWTHLLVNMYVLYFFGDTVESKFIQEFGVTQGRVYFLLVYLLTIIGADIPSYGKHKDNPYYAAIGASGATSGIVFIYCLFYPWSWLGLMFVIPIPAILFAIGYMFYSSWADKNSNDNIGHDAHFYGALFGVLITVALAPSYISEFIRALSKGPTWPF